MSAPMTAEEIKEYLAVDIFAHGHSEAATLAARRLLNHLSAREREHAELLARVERLEAKVMGDGR